MRLSSRSSGSTFSLLRLHYKVATFELEPTTNRGSPDAKNQCFSGGPHLVLGRGGGGGAFSIRGKGLFKGAAKNCAFGAEVKHGMPLGRKDAIMAPFRSLPEEKPPATLPVSMGPGFRGSSHQDPGRSGESQAKPGTEMVSPEPCKELQRRPQPFPAGAAPQKPSSTRVLDCGSGSM